MSLSRFPDFKPYPLLGNAHLQTIAGAYLPTKSQDYTAEQHKVLLPDTDQIVLHDDCPDNWTPKKRSALMIHGLCGCHGSPYMVRIAEKLNRRCIRTFRMDLRGCGAGAAIARHPYHAGRSEDAAKALDFISQLCPQSPVTLLGFSLGGNITLKLLGEIGDSPPGRLDSAFVVGAPIDLALCARTVSKGLNRLYDRNFLRLLKSKIAQRRRLLAENEINNLSLKPRTLYDFDDQFTAPLCGFGTAENYYRRCSSSALLGNIQLPTQILVAADDPVVPVSMYEAGEFSKSTSLHISPAGGHLGFVSAGKLDPDIRWMDWRIVDWVCELGR